MLTRCKSCRSSVRGDREEDDLGPMERVIFKGTDRLIYKLKNNLGLITERIAPLATSSTDWKIIQKVDLRPYFAAGEQLVEHVDSVARACGSRYDATDLLEEASDAARQAERVLDLILTHSEDGEQRRSRRSLVPFVGKIHRFLWGTLDEADEAEIQAAIKVIADDTRQTAALLANQTEIVERELSDLSGKVFKLKVASDILINRTAENNNEIAARNALQNAKSAVTQFKVDTEAVTDAILFAVKGLIHPRIMPPGTISRAAETVKNTVVNAKFPISAGGFSAISVMRVSKISILFTGGHLIYQVAIPLLDIERFNLFKASPIPSGQRMLNLSSVATYIWPEHRYFAISESNRTYMPLPAEKIPKLRKLDDVRIAVDPEPVREIKGNAACEIKVPSGRAVSSPEDCDVRLRQMKDTFWLRLHRANTWVYSTKTVENIFVQCQRAEQISTQIEGAGVLELGAGCAALTANARLTASRSLEARMSESAFDSIQFNVSRIIARLNVSLSSEDDIRQAIADEAATRAKNPHGTELENLEAGAGLREIANRAREIAQRRASAFELRDLSQFTSIFGYSSWSMIATLAIIIGVIWCINRYRAAQPMRELINQQRQMFELEMAQDWRRQRARQTVSQPERQNDRS